MATLPFTTTSGDYLSVLLGIWLPRYGWTLILPTLLCLGIGTLTGDERFLLLALMLLFIIAPMLMSFLYTYYMLTPEARRAVALKRVDISPKGDMTLTYLKEVDEGDDADEKHYEELSKEEIPAGKIIRVKYTSRFRVYVIEAPRLQFILVPHESVIRQSPNK